jgi:hypothetical protein
VTDVPVLHVGDVSNAELAVLLLDCYAALAAGVCADLEATTTTSATISAAIDTLRAAGYPAPMILTNRSDWLATTGVVPQSEPRFAGLDVIFAPVTEPLVLCDPAVWIQVQRPTSFSVTEPSVAGYQFSAVGFYVTGFPDAAVVKVTAA